MSTMEKKFTPGPWAHKHGNRFVASTTRIICDVSRDSESPEMMEEDYANAKLISAAPDLLAALETLSTLLTEYEPPWYLVKHDKLVKAAIKKATL